MATEPGQVGTQNVGQTLASIGQNRRLVISGAIFITVIITLAILVFVWTKGTSKGGQIDLVKRIDQARAFEIISKLKSANIESKIIESDLPGKVNIQVFEKEFDDAALTLARSDLLQEEGYNLFDKSDWAASDYEKRVKLMRAHNGDLSRIVSRMSGIKWATVRVNIPEQQLFSQYEAPTTATVQVELENEGEKLSRTQVKSIINLLVGYVPNIQKSNISIIDTNGITYSTVETEEVVTSELMEESEKVNKVVQKRIEEYLEPVLGLNNYIVRVSTEITRKKVQESSTTFAEGAVGQEQIGDERLGGAAQSGVAAGPELGGDSKGYARVNKVIQRYPSFKQKSVTTPPGIISKVAVAVAINGGLPPGVSLQELKEGIAAIASPNTSADDIKITISEFARPLAVKTKQVREQVAGERAGIIGQVPSFFSNIIESITGFAKKMPLWVNITIAIIGLLIVINSIARMSAPPPASPVRPSTVSQINQRTLEKQLQARGEQQLPSGEEALKIESQEKEDISKVISGLHEAAKEQPEALATRLEVWLEEGTASKI